MRVLLSIAPLHICALRIGQSVQPDYESVATKSKRNTLYSEFICVTMFAGTISNDWELPDATAHGCPAFFAGELPPFVRKSP